MTPRGAAASHLRGARVPVHRTSGPRAARRGCVRSRDRTRTRYTAGQKPGRLAMATAVAPLRGRFIRSASAGTGHAAGPRTRTVRIDDPDPGLLEKTMTRPACAPPPAVPPFRPSRIGRRRRGRHAPHDARRARAAQDRLQRLARLGRVPGRTRQRLVQGSRCRRRFRMVRLLGIARRVSAGKLDAVAATNGDALVTGRPARRT